MKKIFFLIPFLSFFLTLIFLFEYFYRENKINLIDLTGKTLQESIPWISNNEINIVFEDYIIDNNRENGLIISQFPSAESKISTQSRVYLKIIIHQDYDLLNLTGQNIDDIEDILNKKGILYKKIYINSFYPKNLIYAFSFDKIKKFAKIYISNGQQKKFIINNLKNQNCKEIKDKYKQFEFICINNDNEIILNDHNLNICNSDPISGYVILENNLNTKIYLWH